MAAVAREVLRRTGRRHLLVLTDFDGTLAEIVPVPADAVMNPEMHAAFNALAALPAVTMGVISGRRLNDVRARVGPSAEFVAGLHGLEIAGPRDAFAHPALAAAAPAIREIARKATDELAWCHGVFLEDKTFTLTCHVRRVAEADAARALDDFARLARPMVEAGAVRLMTGRKAVELLPVADWHKGRAVDWIRAVVAKERGAPPAVLYLGDDRTDEDAFRDLADDDVAIGVGARPPADLIDWRLPGPAATAHLFEALVRGTGLELWKTPN